MHVAVCDDNVADRKQLERLLKRESELRSANSEPLYIDSFGNATALLSNPMQYDVFYIDICMTAGIDGISVVKALLEKGVQNSIFLCCSHINYKELIDHENVFFIDKPIKTQHLKESLDYAQELKEHSVPLIELRMEKETIYVSEQDILYALEDGRYVNVYLIDHRIIHVCTDAMNLFSQWEMHETFFAPSIKLIINGRHIKKIDFFKVYLVDGSSFHVNGKCMKYARYVFESIKNASL